MWKLNYRHKILPKTVTLLYIITETVRFIYICSSRTQVPREIQPDLRKNISQPELQASSRGIRDTRKSAKRFLWIAFHCFPALSINKITWSLTLFIDFDFYLSATPRSNYTQNKGYFERAADLNCEKLGKIKNLANTSHPRKTLNWVLKKR